MSFLFFQQKITMLKRDYSRFNETVLIEEVCSVNWNKVLPTNDANAIFNSFHSEITEIINKHIPVRKFSKKEIKILKAKPCITKSIKTSINIKNKLFRNTSYKYKAYCNKLGHFSKG